MQENQYRTIARNIQTIDELCDALETLPGLCDVIIDGLGLNVEIVEVGVFERSGSKSVAVIEIREV